MLRLSVESRLLEYRMTRDTEEQLELWTSEDEEALTEAIADALCAEYEGEDDE